MKAESARPYVTLLLRLWQVESSAGPIWRASLESAQTGERHGFAEIEALLAYLSNMTGATSEHVDTESPRRTENPR